ncbi:MAG: IclR family transcriptional regulator [Nocardioidaceae bacterium]
MVAETSQTLDRGLRLLAILADQPRGRTVSELATDLGINRTVVYRLVATLQQHSLVRRDHDGVVHIGLGVVRLARGVEPSLQHKAAPVLRALAEDVGATAHLTITDGEEALAVSVVEPTWTDYHVAYRVGARHPLGRGAAGRALAGPLADPGYVVTQGELQSGAYGVAAPVLGVPALAASVGVVALAELDETRIGPRVVRAAREMAALLT